MLTMLCGCAGAPSAGGIPSEVRLAYREIAAVEDRFAAPSGAEACFHYNVKFWEFEGNDTTWVRSREVLREYLDELRSTHSDEEATRIYEHQLEQLGYAYGMALHPVLTLPQVARLRGPAAMAEARLFMENSPLEPTAYARFIFPELRAEEAPSYLPGQ